MALPFAATHRESWPAPGPVTVALFGGLLRRIDQFLDPASASFLTITLLIAIAATTSAPIVLSTTA
jgi:hypothetical protein